MNRENCVDEMGTCERQRCECERALAEKLAQHEPEWNQFGFYFLIKDSKFKGLAEFENFPGYLNSELRLNPKSLITDDGVNRHSIGSEIVRKNLTKNRPQSFSELLKLQIWLDESRPNREKFQRSLNLIQK